MDQPQPILELRSICKTYSKDLFKPKNRILKNLSFQIEKGKCSGLLGHNGAGKTTTIRAIFGLIKADSGEILFEGQPLSVHHKSKMGYMPEINKLAHTLTPTEILDHQQKIFGCGGNRTARTESKLRDIELWQHRHKRLSQLSKGLARRVAWAQATIHEPELVILDEPFSGLDPPGRLKIRTLLSKLKEDKKSILLCTHDLDSAIELCDDILILNQGKAVYSSKEADQNHHHYVRYGLSIDGNDLSKFSAPFVESLDHSVDEKLLLFEDYQTAYQAFTSCIQARIKINSFGTYREKSSSFLYKYFGDEANSVG